MKKSIYIKNFVITASIVLFSFIILGSVFSLLSYRYLLNEKRGSMSTAATEVTKSISAFSASWDLDSLDMHMTLNILSNMSGYQIILCDSAGTVISTSDRDMDSPLMGKTVSEGMLKTVSDIGQFSGITDLAVYNENKYVVGVQLVYVESGDTAGYVFLSSNTGSMTEIWRQFAAIFVLVAVAVLLLTFVASLITTKKQAMPLREMAAAANKFAKGEFSVRVEDTGREDEVGALANAFNAMADSLEHSETMRRDFIANISHELKTPMTTITGFSDGILDGTIPCDRQEKYLRVISSETRRLSRLVRSMLDMSQLQSMDKAVLSKSCFDISEVIRVALLSLESKITKRGLDVATMLPEEPIVTRGDKDSIIQVIYNLIDNATKFGNPGSTIRLSLWKQGPKAYVSVENEGPTIDAQELPQIFDRFHKTDKSRSVDRDGVGLGLYIVKTILNNHNESISVTSADGVTKFVFSLTICDG